MNLYTAAVLAAEANSEIFFQPANFLNMLPYMGIGMAVIFVIISVIILSTFAINKLLSK